MPVDAITPTFINAPDDVSEPAYDAEELRRAFGGLVAGGPSATVSRSGVLDPRGLVPSLSGNVVQLSPGPCAFGTGKGTYLTGAASVLTVDTLQDRDSTNPRRDRIVAEVLDPDNGGSTARKARFRVITGQPSPTALTGGGYPADPGTVDGVTAFIELGYVDVPKASDATAASITVTSPITAAAGAPIPVRNQAQADALPKSFGATRLLLYVAGVPLEVYDGANWRRLGGPHASAAGRGTIGVVLAGALFGGTWQAFPAGRFTVPPVVDVSTDQTTINATWGGVTKDGFYLYLENVSSRDSKNGVFSWTAVQQTPTSATG